MKSSDLVEAIERFFNDIIGTLIPGMFLLFSIWYLLTTPIQFSGIQIFPPNSHISWILSFLASYVFGHFIISLGNMAIINVIDPIIRFFKNKTYLKWLIPRQCVESSEVLTNICKSHEFKAFLQVLVRQYPIYAKFEPEKENVHALRSIAMTIASEDTHVVYRFMFISLFNLGMSSVLILFVIFQIIILIVNWLDILTLSFNISLWNIAIPAILSLFLLDRRYEFYNRSIKVPFAMALARMTIKNNSSQIKAINTVHIGDSLTPSKYSIYLAGGFRSAWQDKIIKEYQNIKFYDPRSHQLKNKDQYTLWDLEAIRKCDCVFAYLEKDNPGGFALACELGYAKALNKNIILIDEKSKTKDEINRYLSMLNVISDAWFDDLDEGLMFLDKYLKM